ncbi:hypothetical protein ACTPUZ_004886 [Klebsiella variicola]
MCIRCEERKAKKEVILRHANEIADLAILVDGGVKGISDALRITSRLEALSSEDLLEPMSLITLIAHFASQNKELAADNKRLHETLNYMAMSEKSAPSDGNKMSNEEALHVVETIVNTFELAQARAMDGANAQIRELKNRFSINK